MGVAADQTAAAESISRAEQDEYAVRSYRRAAAKTADGRLGAEIAPITLPQRRGDDLVVDRDEEVARVRFEKIPTLRPAFTPDGSATAANASPISDGAAAVLVVGERALATHGLRPLARVAAYADAACAPMRFPLAPTLAAPIALERAGVAAGEVAVAEVNEAFASVPIAFQRALGLDPERVNPNGGAVSLGHPLGTSGARIVGSLAHELSLGGGRYGLAAICNGGGGASAMVLERA